MTRFFSVPAQAYINKMKLVSPSVKQREKILSFHLQDICASIAEPIMCSSVSAQGHGFNDCKVYQPSKAIYKISSSCCLPEVAKKQLIE